MRPRFRSFALVIVLGSLPSLTLAASSWQFEITPYLLGAAMNGTAGVQGVTAEVDASFSDIVDHLDAGLMGLVTARHDRLTLAFEGVYMRLEGGSSAAKGAGGAVSANGTLAWENSLTIYQGSVAYRVAEEKTLVDVVGAIRSTAIDLEAAVTTQFTPGLAFGGGSLNAGGSESWIDPAIGVRVEHPVGKTVSLLGYADVGSGGSDLSWQVIAGLNWAYADRYTAKFGYRVVDWDYESNGTTWDMSASGPYAGLGIRF